MKKIIFVLIIIFCFNSEVFAYTYSATTSDGKVLKDETCKANGNYFYCHDKVSGNTYSEPRRQREVKDVYINGQHKRVVVETYGDKVFINP